MGSKKDYMLIHSNLTTEIKRLVSKCAYSKYCSDISFNLENQMEVIIIVKQRLISTIQYIAIVVLIVDVIDDVIDVKGRPLIISLYSCVTRFSTLKCEALNLYIGMILKSPLLQLVNCLLTGKMSIYTVRDLFVPRVGFLCVLYISVHLLNR